MTENTVSEAHFGEEDYAVVDKEWEEFGKLLQVRRKERKAQTFYPCPPPEEDDDVNFVRIIF